MSEFHRLRDEADPEAWIPGAVSWVHDAGRPYVDWLFGSDEAARAATERWMSRSSSEIHVGRATILADDGGQIGGFVAMPGSELESCRKSDAVAALGEAVDRAALIQRLRAASRLFADVSGDQFYLSRLAVEPGRRGEGHGARLAHEYLAAGERAGFRRFRLDVSADNEAAVGLYRSLGFKVVSEAGTPGGDIAYLGMAAKR